MPVAPFLQKNQTVRHSLIFLYNVLSHYLHFLLALFSVLHQIPLAKDSTDVIKLNCKFIHKWYTPFKKFLATLPDEKNPLLLHCCIATLLPGIFPINNSTIQPFNNYNR